MAKTVQPSDFVHLHNHSHYSLLDGLTKIPALVDRVAELGMESVAITDHGTLSGAIEFYSAAKERSIKPIIGMETYVAARSMTDRDPTKDKARFHLILLAMNNQGYENLMRLSSMANLEGFYHKPRVDHELLEKYNEGLIVLSGCIGGEVGERLRYDDDEKAKEVASWYKQVFGDRYYLEVQDHGHMWAEQGRVNEKVLALAKELDIPPVVTCDAHYLKHEDQEAHEILLCVQTGAYLSDQDRMSLTETDLYVTDPKDVIKRWAKHPEVITNTKALADRCDVTIELGKILIPTFPLPPGEKDERTYLHKLVWQGLAHRYTDLPRIEAAELSVEAAKKRLPAEIIERADYELSVVKRMGFDGYFLIVQDFINWGKDKGIVFGPGRGSAAGSIVAYSLNITDLDPLKYDLLFERFLNPDRISMPDIDIDIQDTRRDEVIRYCVEKYGQDQVAHIVTFGTMAARNAIRDVARVLQVPYTDADRLAKLVPPPVQGRHIPLATSIKADPELKAEYEQNADSKRVIDLAMRLEGTIRSHGVHAAGVVIAPDELVKFTPLEMAQKGVVATQYSMGPIEELGLLKMDFLGLSNLTIVKNALRIIKKVWNEDIDISKLPLDDLPTLELLGRGDTTGIFQFESSGMKRYIRELKPSVFEDLVAMGALYRPGPLTAGLTQKFIDRKNGREPISYEHESMKNALEPTYGVLVYQEQVMRIAQDMCGFTGGEADTLRKAIGKKKRDVMAKMKKQFVEGAVKTSGASPAFVEKFWKDLEGFADYAFNKSHAACYAMISYWTAYLKAHYPTAFMAALMTSDGEDTDRLAIEISECRRMGIEVLLPDVNESFAEFAVVPNANQIRFGMAAVKNVGSGVVDEIVRIRDEGGEYKSVEDFVSRVSTRTCNRKTWESLIRAGAFDRFGDRGTLLFNLDTILAYGTKQQRDAALGQTDLFGEASEMHVAAKLQLEPSPTEQEEREMLQWERELLGLYLSKHPLEDYRTYLDEQAVPIAKLKKEMDGGTTKVAGIINAVRVVVTKKGTKMGFIKFEDFSGELELIVFPDLYSEHEKLWQRDTVLLIKGRVNSKDRDGHQTEEIKIIPEEVSEVTPETLQAYKPTGKRQTLPRGRGSRSNHRSEVPAEVNREDNITRTVNRLYLHLKDPSDTGLLLSVKQLLSRHEGGREAILVLGENSKQAIRLPFTVADSDDLVTAARDLLGTECVAVR